MLLASCSHVILHAIKMTRQRTRIRQANVVNMSLITSTYTKASRQHKPYLKVLNNTYAFLLLDNLMESYNMATLSMEPRK